MQIQTDRHVRVCNIEYPGQKDDRESTEPVNLPQVLLVTGMNGYTSLGDFYANPRKEVYLGMSALHDVGFDCLSNIRCITVDDDKRLHVDSD